MTRLIGGLATDYRWPVNGGDTCKELVIAQEREASTNVDYFVLKLRALYQWVKNVNVYSYSNIHNPSRLPRPHFHHPASGGRYLSPSPRCAGKKPPWSGPLFTAVQFNVFGRDRLTRTTPLSCRIHAHTAIVNVSMSMTVLSAYRNRSDQRKTVAKS